MTRYIRKCFTILCLLALMFGVFGSVNITTTQAATKFSAKTAKKKIKATYKQVEEGVIATYTNKNTYAVRFIGKVSFYDAAGSLLSTEKIENRAFGKSKKVVFFFRGPKNNVGQFTPYSSYKTSFSVKKCTNKDYTKKIKIDTSVDGIICKVTTKNLAPKDLMSINATFVFYDASGDFICARNQYFTCKRANTSQSLEISIPEYNKGASKVKVYLNWAY